MKTKLFRSFSIFILILMIGGFFIFGKSVKAATIDHLVISEVKYGTTTSASDEFIEIYNPTNSTIIIDGSSFFLKKINATGTISSINLTLNTTAIPPHGFFLIGTTSTTGLPAGGLDAIYSATLTATSGIFLKTNNINDLSGFIDGLIWSTTIQPPAWPEGTSALNFGNGESLERKASEYSTASTLSNGGLEEYAGNGYDSNNNANDFIKQTTPNPQNSSSPAENDPPLTEPPPSGPICGNSICETGEDFLICPTDCSASPAEPGIGDVVINEFVSDPTEGNEWIELYNKKGFDINLTGWVLEDGVGVIAPLSGIIAANGVDKFKVFELSSSKLNNDGDIIKLKKSDGTIIDQVTYGNWDDGNKADNAPKASDPNAVARKTDGSDTDSDVTDFTITSTLTKGTSNVITSPPSSGEGNAPPLSPPPSPPPSSPPSWPVGSLLINEFVADPTDGANEWIELYNTTNSLINLNGWTIEDGSETVTELSGNIQSLSFIVIEKPKGILNNTGDIIILKDPAGLIIDKVAYGDWDDGEKSDNAPAAKNPDSVARIVDGQDSNNDFRDFVIAMPTKGTSNAGGIKEKVGAAYSRDIIINEVLPNPKGDDSQNEFIELKNISTTEIDLAGWKLGDNSTKTYTIKTKDFTSTKIKPGEFFVFYRKITGIALNNSGVESVKLYGPDSTLITSIEYSGNIKEDQSYARSDTEYFWTSTPTPGKENIITRENQTPKAVISAPTEAEIGEIINFDGSDSTDPDNDALTFSWNFGDGTEAAGTNVNHVYRSVGKFKIILTVKDVNGATNSAEQFIKIIDPDNLSAALPVDEQLIFINEILPNPEGADDAEWIEILSLALKPFDLSGWKLDDDEGGSRPYKIPDGTIINPGQYLVFKKEQTKLALNNTSDAVRLLDPDGEIFFEISYDEVPEGASYARDDDGSWHWTTKLTPGAENIFQFKEKTTTKTKKTTLSTKKTSTKKSTSKFVETTLEEIRNQDLGDKVKITGQIIVEPGILGTQIFYIANEEACPGIQIYMYKKDFPELHLGDLVEITGVLSESGGEKRVKVSQKSDIKILEEKEAPTPVLIKLSEIEEGFEGCLVSASGEITEKSSSNWYLADENGELKIYFKSTLPFSKPKIQIGDNLEITGIISQTKTGFRLLPRYETDIKIKPPTVEQPTTIEIPPNNRSNQVNKFLGAAAGILGLTLIGLGLKTGIFASWWKKIKGL